MKKVLIIITACVILSGCDYFSNYQLVQSQSGELFRINKSTGEVYLIKGDSIVKLSDNSKRKGFFNWEKPIARTWPSQKISNSEVNVSLKTKWMDGKIYYIVELSPYNGKMQSAMMGIYNMITINFCDANGFNVLSLPIGLNEMTKTNDETGNISSISCNKNADCSLNTYLKGVYWVPQWNF